MREREGDKHILPTTAITLCLIVLGIGLLADSASVAQGIREGLTVCGNVLVPALFPFMVLAGFISRTRYAYILSAPLEPFMSKVYKLPSGTGAVLLLSLIGGYPVGARMVANLLEDGQIGKKTAERMLCFCVNCGPSFLISAVGIGMLHNKKAGLLLFGSQTVATLIIGVIISLKVKAPKKRSKREVCYPGGVAFVSSVTAASSSIIAMCSFAVLFSGILAMVRSSGIYTIISSLFPVDPTIVEAVINGLFEVTGGCLKATAVGGIAGIMLTSAVVSFGGLSVMFQIISCFPPGKISFKPFVLSRLAHSLLSVAILFPFCWGPQEGLAVWNPSTVPVLHADNKTFVISCCLLAMCSILVLSTGKKYR